MLVAPAFLRSRYETDANISNISIDLINIEIVF